MKHALFLLIGIFLLAQTASAQQKYMVVKFSGDTLYFDELTAGGKTIVCKSKGSDKIRLNADEVNYYLQPYKLWVQNEGEKKAHEVDTTKKCFVPADGRIYTISIENDSVRIGEIEDTQGFTDYFIFRKKDNSEIKKIKKDKSALEDLKKYFGGACKTLDNQIAEFQPKFQKAKFPYEEWYTLLYTYNTKCVQ